MPALTYILCALLVQAATSFDLDHRDIDSIRGTLPDDILSSEINYNDDTDGLLYKDEQNKDAESNEYGEYFKIDYDTGSLSEVPYRRFDIDPQCRQSYFLENIVVALIDVVENSKNQKREVLDRLAETVNAYFEYVPPELQNPQLIIKLKKLLDISDIISFPKNALDQSLRSSNNDTRTRILFKQKLPKLDEPPCKDAFLKLIGVAYKTYLNKSKFDQCITEKEKIEEKASDNLQISNEVYKLLVAQLAPYIVQSPTAAVLLGLLESYKPGKLIDIPDQVQQNPGQLYGLLEQIILLQNGHRNVPYNGYLQYSIPKPALWRYPSFLFANRPINPNLYHWPSSVREGIDYPGIPTSSHLAYSPELGLVKPSISVPGALLSQAHMKVANLHDYSKPDFTGDTGFGISIPHALDVDENSVNTHLNALLKNSNAKVPEESIINPIEGYPKIIRPTVPRIEPNILNTYVDSPADVRIPPSNYIGAPTTDANFPLLLNYPIEQPKKHIVTSTIFNPDLIDSGIEFPHSLDIDGNYVNKHLDQLLKNRGEDAIRGVVQEHPVGNLIHASTNLQYPDTITHTRYPSGKNKNPFVIDGDDNPANYHLPEYVDMERPNYTLIHSKDTNEYKNKGSYPDTITHTRYPSGKNPFVFDGDDNPANYHLSKYVDMERPNYKLIHSKDTNEYKNKGSYPDTITHTRYPSGKNPFVFDGDDNPANYHLSKYVDMERPNYKLIHSKDTNEYKNKGSYPDTITHTRYPSGKNPFVIDGDDNPANYHLPVYVNKERPKYELIHSIDNIKYKNNGLPRYPLNWENENYYRDGPLNDNTQQPVFHDDFTHTPSNSLGFNEQLNNLIDYVNQNGDVTTATFPDITTTTTPYSTTDELSTRTESTTTFPFWFDEASLITGSGNNDGDLTSTDHTLNFPFYQSTDSPYNSVQTTQPIPYTYPTIGFTTSTQQNYQYTDTTHPSITQTDLYYSTLSPIQNEIDEFNRGTEHSVDFGGGLPKKEQPLHIVHLEHPTSDVEENETNHLALLNQELETGINFPLAEPFEANENLVENDEQIDIPDQQVGDFNNTGVESHTPQIDIPDEQVNDVINTGVESHTPQIDISDQQVDYFSTNTGVESHTPQIDIPDQEDDDFGTNTGVESHTPQIDIPDQQVGDFSTNTGVESHTPQIDIPDQEVDDSSNAGVESHTPQIDIPDQQVGDFSTNTGVESHTPQIDIPDQEVDDSSNAGVESHTPQIDIPDQQVGDFSTNTGVESHTPQIDIPDQEVDDSSNAGVESHTPQIDIPDQEVDDISNAGVESHTPQNFIRDEQRSEGPDSFNEMGQHTELFGSEEQPFIYHQKIEHQHFPSDQDEYNINAKTPLIYHQKIGHQHFPFDQDEYNINAKTPLIYHQKIEHQHFPFDQDEYNINVKAIQYSLHPKQNIIHRHINHVKQKSYGVDSITSTTHSFTDVTEVPPQFLNLISSKLAAKPQNNIYQVLTKGHGSFYSSGKLPKDFVHVQTVDVESDHPGIEENLSKEEYGQYYDDHALNEDIDSREYQDVNIHGLVDGGVVKLKEITSHQLPDAIEFTYVVKRPQPIVYRPYYYVMYRIPYATFLTSFKHLLELDPTLKSHPNKLFGELIDKSNISAISPGLENVSARNINKLIAKDGSIVKAKLAVQTLSLRQNTDEDVEQLIGELNRLVKEVSPDQEWVVERDEKENDDDERNDDSKPNPDQNVGSIASNAFANQGYRKIIFYGNKSGSAGKPNAEYDLTKIVDDITSSEGPL